jgi:hypothetical protein
MRPVLAVVIRALACWLWVVAAGLLAQEQVVHHEQDGLQICSVRLVPHFGAAVTGGYGWVSVELRNHDRAPHRVALALSSPRWSGQDFRSSRECLLEPEATLRFHWPVPTRSGSTAALAAVCSIDGKQYPLELQPSATAPDSVLLLTDGNDLQSMLVSVIAAEARSSQPEIALALARSQEAAADWRCYTGFCTVVVDGRMPLANGLQEALRRYVSAGGRVLLLQPDALPPGPLRRVAELGGDERREGFGSWGILREQGLANQRMLNRWIFRGVNQGLWPLAPWRQEIQTIPGLGAAPVLLFLAMILIFAVVAGPVNFLLVRRMRRPLLLLLTVPALGFGTTLLLLLHGLWHDGLGVRGMVHSYSYLDQEQHEVATFADRTLFAGFSPGRLSLDADSLLVAPACFVSAHGERNDPPFVVDWSRGTVEGGVLPSRTLTTLLSARQAAERARLRARILPDGDLELLTDGDLKPIGEILWCDASGQCWRGEAPRLARCDAQSAAAALRALRTQIAKSRAEVGWEDPEDYEWRANGRRARAREVSIARDLAQAVLRHDEPEPGHWYGYVAAAPWLPDHGLAVAHDLQEHFVIGRLAAEDVQR